MAVLVTGGAGFIGSHTCVELLDHGIDVVVVDDYSNGSPAALQAVRDLTGRPLIACQADVRDQHALDRVFNEHPVDAVIHFAAKKAVGESTQIPVDYYDVNVAGTLTLLKSMLAHGVRRLVYSSSAAVYGNRSANPVTEDDEPAPESPYARTKLMGEQILADACAAHDDLSVVALRYFNPSGAHPSGMVGEDPHGTPANLMPCLLQVAAGAWQKLQLFGTDYPTADGSGVRDYIHVMDLADAHRAALDHLADQTGMAVYNVGTGTGYSVLEFIAAFETASGTTIPYQTVDRRPGDVASLIADASQIEAAWGWRTTRDLAAMCRDSWHFRQRNPHGYPRQAR